MWEELRWKVLCMYKWGGIYSQGWNWPLWFFNYPHDCLTSMTFRLYMTLCITSGSFGLPRYITLIEKISHNRDVGNMTRHHSVGTFVLLLEWMSSYSAIGWWMSSWCITASPPHGKVCRVFDGIWFTWWCLGTLVLACMLEGLMGSYVCERFMFVRLWAHLACLLVCLSTNTSLHDHPFMIISLCMHRMFVCWWTYPSSCAPRGNWQFVAGSLAAKTVQFLKGTGSQVLELGSQNCTIPRGNF